MAAAYIVDVVRTPRGIGKPGKGALAHLHPQQVGATVLRAIRDRNQLDTGSVDDVIWSTSMQSGKQGFDLGRMSALAAGYEVRASGATLSRFCGGGISAVSWAAASVMAGMEDCLIAGGTEMMSYQAAYSGEQNAAGINSFLLDAGNGALDGLHPQSHQGVCADAIASLERIERDALDALALESQRRAARAIAQGRFGGSLTAVLNEDGAVALDHEEFPRPDTTAEGLASLKPAFAAIADLDLGGGKTFRKQINRRYPDMDIRPVHHAGTSSGVVDGAAAVLVASAPYIERQGLRARARILAYANVGDCPTLMLNAPGPAARKALAKAGLNVKDIDVWEINEAFAVVVEKVIRDLDLDREKVNINGGAMALGHPIGATGAILIGTALDELERSGGRYGLVTMCAAGGMAPAIIIERLDGG